MRQPHNLDSSHTAKIHKEMIQRNKFLRMVYLDLYNEFKSISAVLPKGLQVEIGSGAGFLKQVIPEVITTDVFYSDGIDVVLKKGVLPFKDNSVAAYFLLDVLHHIQDVSLFFSEVNRSLINSGRIIMIEPHNSLIGGFLYKNFHHENFDTKASWELTNGGRLTASNIALPWIIFYRDRKRFEKMFPNLKIKRLEPHTPFRYHLSGGLSFKQLLPAFTYNLIKGIESILTPLNKYLGMFITIELEKNSQ